MTQRAVLTGSVPDPANTDTGPGRRAGWVTAFRVTTAVPLVAGGVYALVAPGVLGPLGLVMVALLVLVVPVADTLSGRVALVGTAVLGWTPVLWFVPWPFGVDHGALLAAVAAATVAAWAVARPTRTAAKTRWRPVVHPVDAVPPVLGLLTTALLVRFLTTLTPRSALVQLLPGYDNVAHFSMFEMLRTHGATMDRVPSPDSSGWHYSNYPQGFHMVAATTAELAGWTVTSPTEELVVYARCVVLVVVATVVCLAAAVCSVPALRARPVLAALVAFVVVTAAVVGPGATAVPDGFAPFWFAAALVSTVVVLSLGVDPSRLPAVTLALGGAAVGIAYSWAPLLLLAGPAVLAALLRLLRGRGGLVPRRSLVVVAVVVVGTAAAVARVAVSLTRTVGLHRVVTANGGFNPPDPTLLLLVVVLAVVVCVVLTRIPVTGRSGSLLRGARGLGWVVVAGIGTTAVLVVDQLRTTGTVSYYFFKYVEAVELVLVTVVAVGVAALAASLAERGAIGRRRGAGRVARVSAVAGTLVAVPVLLSFGQLAPPATLASHEFGTSAAGPAATRSLTAQQILAAARMDPPGRPTVMLSTITPPRGDMTPALPQQWLLALTETWTNAAEERGNLMQHRVATTGAVAEMATRLLESYPDLVVLVPPVELDAIAAAVDDPALRGRVRAWVG